MTDELTELRDEVEQWRTTASESYEDGYDQGHADAHADGAAEDRVCRAIARAEKAEQECRDRECTEQDVRARLADAENALADLRLKIEIEAQWFYAHHDGSLVTSDYPMVARRIHALLDGTS